MQRWSTLCSSMLVVLALAAPAQGDTTRGTVGKQLCFQLSLPASARGCPLRAQLRLSNPTVWYPTALWLGSVSARLDRQNDTLWLVEATVDATDTATICGLVLAGSDSICTVTLDSVDICSRPYPPQTHVLLVSSVGPPLPYVRFARIEGPYPFPVERHSPWAVYVGVDAPSRVALRLYDLLGRLVLEYETMLERGAHRIELTLPSGIAPGLYLLRMESSTGSAQTPIIVE